MGLLQLRGLLLQMGELVVEVRVALHRRLGLVVLKELARLGLGGALQVGPALSDLLQLLLDDRTQLRLLLDQLQALLETESQVYPLNNTVRTLLQLTVYFNTC